MFKLLFYFLGIFLVSIGIFFTIIYINLLTIGYSFFEFVNFIIRSPIFWCIIIGIIFNFKAPPEFLGGAFVFKLILLLGFN